MGSLKTALQLQSRAIQQVFTYQQKYEIYRTCRKKGSIFMCIQSDFMSIRTTYILHNTLMPSMALAMVISDFVLFFLFLLQT